MKRTVARTAVTLLAVVALVPLQAATISRQLADAFDRKIDRILDQADAAAPAPQRTVLTEDEVNSWFTYRAPEYLPDGVTQPQLAILGDGRVSATAVVDLDAVSRQRQRGGTLDPWSLVGGRVPLRATGILHTRDGMARIELQTAEISGVPVPVTLVHELVGFYSRTPERPQGVRLADAFELPSNIREVQIGRGQAIIVQ